MNRTTAYHPQANGLVERFHRRLKESLTTRLNGPNWIDQVPWVMLGIHTAPKENLNPFSAGMVYVAPLTVPGEFFMNTNLDLDVKRYLAQLRDSVGQLRPVPMSTYGTPRSSVPNDLRTANFVFVRRDTRRRPSSQPTMVHIKSYIREIKHSNS
uniref:Integrase catalytic domain-containing protein n=1 Tax=Octopus bimaculoides TaxID=37653 RepID=A0A0L8GUF9_OCTBM